MNMRLPIVMLVGLLAGCASHPAEPPPAPEAAPAPTGAGCKQAGWQAETAPVINKRQGQEALERYDPDSQPPGSGCR